MNGKTVTTGQVKTRVCFRGSDSTAAQEGKWTGPCPPDMKPGDLVTGNGVKVNAFQFVASDARGPLGDNRCALFDRIAQLDGVVADYGGDQGIATIPSSPRAGVSATIVKIASQPRVASAAEAHAVAPLGFDHRRERPATVRAAATRLLRMAAC